MGKQKERMLVMAKAQMELNTIFAECRTQPALLKQIPKYA